MLRKTEHNVANYNVNLSTELYSGFLAGKGSGMGRGGWVGFLTF